MKKLGLDAVVANPRRGRTQNSDLELRGWRALKRLAKTRTDGSIVVLHYSGSSRFARTARVATMAAMTRPSQLILLQHNGAYSEVLNGTGLVSSMHRRLVRRAAVVLCLSSALERAALDADPNATTVRCGSFIPSDFLEDLRHKRRNKRSPKPPVVVTSGYRTPTYQYEEIIDAIEDARSHHPEVQLHLYCYGATDQPYWDTIVAKANQFDNVVIHNDITVDKWLIRLSEAALYIRNTSHDSYGVAVAEALFLRIPAIATSVCERTPGSVLFDLGDTATMTQLVCEMIGNQVLDDVEDPGSAIDGYLEAFAHV